MSYYTEFEFKAKLNDDYPKILDKVVNHMDEIWREYYNGEDRPEKYLCGTPTPEFDIEETCDLKHVNCKKCLKLIEKDERTTTE